MRTFILCSCFDEGLVDPDCDDCEGSGQIEMAEPWPPFDEEYEDEYAERRFSVHLLREMGR